MRILVTAGNTQTEIDRVRCITNIFSGRTGTSIALEGARRGHDVLLLTSQPELLQHERPAVAGEVEIESFRTFDDLESLMSRAILCQDIDAIVHCAAVSDYQVAGVYSPIDGARFDDAHHSWSGPSGTPMFEDVRAGKVKSRHSELWIRMVPAPKLVDKVRREWGFLGVLVKFKLEVGVDEGELVSIAESSRQASSANLIVANTLDGMNDWAWIVWGKDQVRRVPRSRLAPDLIAATERAVSMPKPSAHATIE